MTEPSAETLGSGTPILDRLAPLPPRAAPGSGLSVLLVFWLRLALLVAAAWFLNEPPGLRQWLLTDVRPCLVDGKAPLGDWDSPFGQTAGYAKLELRTVRSQGGRCARE